MTDSPGQGLGKPFSDRVVVLFLTSVVTSGVGIFNGFVLARLLGPSAKGDYYLLTLLPSTIMVLIQLGLPQAFNFYSARGKIHRLTAKAVAMTAVIGLPALAATVLILPWLRNAFLAGVDPGLIVFALLTLPVALLATYGTGIVLGRQAVRWYASVNIIQVFAYSLLLVVLVAFLGLGLVGALVVFVVMAVLQTAGFLIGALRLTAKDSTDEVSIRELFRYGLRLYPGSMTHFFSYRADVFILAALLAQPSAPLGYYSMAVSMAEMVFFFPNAVGTLLFPHVAGSATEDSARQVPMVSRVTLLVTAVFGLALVPVASVLIPTFLPAFGPSLPALYILLPGVVALSVTKVLAGYLSGLGRTGLTSSVHLGAFILNVAVNLVLIPRFGILGASAASLISYSVSSIAFSAIAARLANARVLDFWIPRRSDIRFVQGTAAALGRRALRRRVNPA
jgi:O-antigen/teichoic acid export membrane protein